MTDELGQAFRNDAQAIARVEELLRSLKSEASEPLNERVADLQKRIDEEAGAFRLDDLRTMLEAGRQQGLQKVMGALFGPDQVIFTSTGGEAAVRFEERDDIFEAWWRHLNPSSEASEG